MLRKYEYRRRLPHYQPDHKIFFITFCTHKRWKLPPSCRQIVIEVCRRGDGVLFELLAMVVMPDHVHLALCPLSTPDGTFSIPRSCRRLKGRRLIGSISKSVTRVESGNRNLSTGLCVEKSKSRTRSFTCWRIQCGLVWSEIRWTIRGVGGRRRVG